MDNLKCEYYVCHAHVREKSLLLFIPTIPDMTMTYVYLPYVH